MIDFKMQYEMQRLKIASKRSGNQWETASAHSRIQFETPFHAVRSDSARMTQEKARKVLYIRPNISYYPEFLCLQEESAVSSRMRGVITF
jgi:hypothetical protein